MDRDLRRPPSIAPCRAVRSSGLLVLALAATVSGVVFAQIAPPAGPMVAEAPFLAESDAAMARMMAAMTIRPSGDVDVDFAAMMIPHHQGAIDMAEAELRNGHNEALRRIAQEIVVDQQQEIAAMRLAIGQPLPPSAPSPTEPAPASAEADQTLSSSAMHMAPSSVSMKAKAPQ